MHFRRSQNFENVCVLLQNSWLLRNRIQILSAHGSMCSNCLSAIPHEGVCAHHFYNAMHAILQAQREYLT